MIILNENRHKITFESSNRPILKITLSDISPSNLLMEVKRVLDKIMELHSSQSSDIMK